MDEKKESVVPKKFDELPDGFEFYRAMGSPKYICAPMVDQSELPFRLLCHKYDVDLCYTPMIHSRHFLIQSRYRNSVFETCANDKPVIAQFCGNNSEILYQAASLVCDKVDAIDLNFGCPQGIAKRGNYGAFLLDQEEIMYKLISTLYEKITLKQMKKYKNEKNNCKYPCQITCKIRIKLNENETIKMCQNLEKCGIALLAVHGRTRFEKKQSQHGCNWDIIKKIKKSLNIPVFANGGCQTLMQVKKCLQYTKCDGYMAAEPLLCNPAMFMVCVTYSVYILL